MAKVDASFGTAADRSGELVRMLARVYSMVTNFRSARYRDFPDPQRR